MNEMNEINIDDIIKSYFDRDNVLIAHQINSYNYYMDTIIPSIISQYFPIEINFNDPQLAITPGQSIVFYVNNKLVGGGIIKLYE